MEAKRIFCVGKVHDGFVTVRFGKPEPVQFPRQEDEAIDVDEELIEYIEDQLDREDWARGQW